MTVLLLIYRYAFENSLGGDYGSATALSIMLTAVLAVFIPIVPLLLLFPLIALMGLISEMNFYPIVVIAQRALPRHVGFASGVTLGLSIGLGALAPPLLGIVADNTSLRAAVTGAAGLAVLAALVSLALPRIRDFRGLSPKQFDGNGNYTFGLQEQSVFHEIDQDKIDRVRGFDITVVTTAKTDAEGRALLRGLGFPFRSEENAQA